MRSCLGFYVRAPSARGAAGLRAGRGRAQAGLRCRARDEAARGGALGLRTGRCYFWPSVGLGTAEIDLQLDLAAIFGLQLDLAAIFGLQLDLVLLKSTFMYVHLLIFAVQLDLALLFLAFSWTWHGRCERAV